MDRTEQQNLVAQFTERVHQRLNRIADLLMELRQDGRDTERLGELMSMFHNLTGSGDTYGFYELSRISRRGEDLCNLLQQDGRSAEEPELRALHAIAQELTACVQREKAAAELALLTALQKTTQVSAPEVIVVEWTDEVRERLVAQAHAAGLPARGLSTQAELLAERTTAPTAVIADSSVVAREGFTLLTKLRNLPGGDRTVIILIGSLNSFSDKVSALSYGANAYFEHDVDPATVFERLQELLDSRQQRSGSILVVDDDTDHVAILRAVLQGAGYSVHSCTDPRYFDQELALAKPNLIIMDIRMPGILGTDLVLYIRQDQIHRGVPIIILSAMDQEKLQAETAMSCDMYLQKPVSLEVLLNAVASCLDNARRRGTVTPIEIIVP